MSLTHEVTVWCDGELSTTEEPCASYRQGSCSTKELRERLKPRGWTKEGTKDFCPACSQRRREEKA